MQPFTTLTAVGVPLDERNVDTNQLCPTRFNKIPEDDPEYARILFNNQRFAPDGRVLSDFILNQAPFDHAGIMVADDNFGCGSSRESAVYALVAFGIRCVIAPSFGDIFAANAAKNGLLTVELPSEVCDELRTQLREAPGTTLSVDLEQCKLTVTGGRERAFSVHATVRRNLLGGLDDVGVTQQFASEIEAFEARHKHALPWAFSD
jgi:3-isopropylmalate/(R)-2-methylmalate dehydratase small subunit